MLAPHQDQGGLDAAGWNSCSNEKQQSTSVDEFLPATNLAACDNVITLMVKIINQKTSSCSSLWNSMFAVLLLISWCFFMYNDIMSPAYYMYAYRIIHNLKLNILKHLLRILPTSGEGFSCEAHIQCIFPFTVFNHVYRRSLTRPVMGKNNGWAIQSLMLFLLKRNGKRFPSVWLSYNCESNFGMNPFTSGTFNKFLGQPCGIHWFSPTVYSIII